MTFANFFLAEYAHIIFMSVLFVILFLGGWNSPLGSLINGSLVLAIKTSAIIFWFVWVRGSFPRMRYDQLMSLLWKNYLPLSLGFVVLVGSLVYSMNALPSF
jgi:NADH:ubiquinone oxidoreductase subunit H